MKCELCAYSLEACHIAARLGIDRVELCASPADGGTTPSIASIERASAISGIDVSVMIRPRGGDFLYTDEEFHTMLDDIAHARQAGATGQEYRIGRSYFSAIRLIAVNRLMKFFSVSMFSSR